MKVLMLLLISRLLRSHFGLNLSGDPAEVKHSTLVASCTLRLKAYNSLARPIVVFQNE